MLTIPDSVKTLFKTDDILKNIRVSFPNGEFSDISNDRLLKESLKFDESISSREEIKFGLCEGSTVSFECVGVENIKGCEIAVYVEIDVSSLSTQPSGTQTSSDVPFPFYRVSLGRFIVDECKRDAKMLKRKVTAYSALIALKMPGYMNATNPDPQITDFNVTHFLMVCNNKLFPIENVSFSALNILGWSFDPGNYTYFKSWTYNGDTIRCNAVAKMYLGSISGQAYNNKLNLEYLWRCNNSGVSNSDITSVEEGVERFIENWKASASIHNTPTDAYDRVRTLVKNALRPTPYGNAGESRFLNGVNVGDLFAANARVFYLSEIDIRISINNVDVLTYNYVNNTDRSAVSYDVADTSYYPSYTIALDGMEASWTNYYVFILAIADLNVRTLLENYVELQGCFGRMGRDGNFEFLNISHMVSGLFPNIDIYPSTDLYPTALGDISYLIPVEEESTLSVWYDEYFVQFGRIICTYYSSEKLDENNNPLLITHEKEWDDREELLTYDLSNNDILNGNKYTGYTEEEVDAMLEPLITALKGLQFYPTEVEIVGLPYIEAGDWVLPSVQGNKVPVLSLSRSMSGIQALRDKVRSD